MNKRGNITLTAGPDVSAGTAGCGTGRLGS